MSMASSKVVVTLVREVISFVGLGLEPMRLEIVNYRIWDNGKSRWFQRRLFTTEKAARPIFGSRLETTAFQKNSIVRISRVFVVHGLNKMFPNRTSICSIIHEFITNY